MMEALKRCPFCGSEADWMDDEYVWCINPNCKMHTKYEYSVDTWNHRPIEDAIQARITQLEEQIAELSVSLHHARQLAESAHRVAELAWGGEIPSPLPGHRRQTEEEFAAEMERLNCPLCGGSGHVGDADTAIAERIAQLETVAEAAKEVLQDIDPRSDDYTQHCATLEEALQAAGYGRE